MKEIFHKLIILLISTAFTFFLWGRGVSIGETACEYALEEALKVTSLLKRKEALEGLIKRCEGDPEVNYQYAYTLERLRRYEDALRFYKRATELGPDNAKYYFGLGDVYRVLGRYSDALYTYEKGLRRSSGNRRVERYVKELREKVKESQGENYAKEKVPEEVKRPSLESKGVKRSPITLSFEQPYSGRIALSGLLNQMIKTRNIDDLMGKKALKELTRRKALDERYFIRSQVR